MHDLSIGAQHFPGRVHFYEHKLVIRNRSCCFQLQPMADKVRFVCLSFPLLFLICPFLIVLLFALIFIHEDEVDSPLAIGEKEGVGLPVKFFKLWSPEVLLILQ